jgi:hypothetical protein
LKITEQSVRGRYGGREVTTFSWYIREIHMRIYLPFWPNQSHDRMATQLRGSVV